MDKLLRSSVLVLNSAWQAINTDTPQNAFCQIASGVSTGLDVSGEIMIPTKWKNWLKLPIREHDEFVMTSVGPVRLPTIIVLCNYSKVPKSRPKFSSSSIWIRDEGRCQFSGRKLSPKEGNIDHVIPKSKGGKSTWDNCVLSDKKLNSIKADRTLQEAGLKLIRKPKAPTEVPITMKIQNKHNIPEWDLFLIK